MECLSSVERLKEALPWLEVKDKRLNTCVSGECLMAKKVTSLRINAYG